MSSALREPSAAEPAPGPELSLVPGPGRVPAPKLVLAGIYALALAYNWLQSRAHVSPAVFPDELLYSKLAQSLVSGHGFSVRGATVFFPAPLAALAQAPAWLIHSTPDAYEAAKALNAAVMTAAVFPAYAVARRLVRPSYALLAAAMTVAGPPMLYGAYLMSEALAYPVFLLALATMLRAIERPSRRMEAAVVAVSLAAVLTRLQFVVVPIAYLLAAPLAGKLAGEPLRAVVRRHRLSIGALLALGGLPLLTGGAVLGTYRGAAFLHYDIASVLSWSGLTAALLPFAAGWLVVPGAILGLVLLAQRPLGSSSSPSGREAEAMLGSPRSRSPASRSSCSRSDLWAPVRPGARSSATRSTSSPLSQSPSSPMPSSVPRGGERTSHSPWAARRPPG